MIARLPICRLMLAAALAVLAVAGPAGAQMTLIEDGRVLSARARYQNLTDLDEIYPDGPFGLFNEIAEASAEHSVPCGDPPELCLVGRTDAYADQTSEFFPDGLQFTGVTAGHWQGDPDGSYEVRSLARFVFRVDHPFKYNLNAILSPADTPVFGLSTGYVRLVGPDGLEILTLTNGALTDSSRLGPGEYALEGLSYGDASDEGFVGAYYFAQWTITEIILPLVAYQPQDITVACGGTATFSVTPSGAPGSITYQWRRNLQPLSNGGGISGATSNSLSIAGACVADAGYYDVVLSDGTVTEPSRFALLSVVSGVTGAESGSPETPRPFSLRLAGSNPFHGETAFRYDSAAPQPATIAIYGVNGAKVRSLVNGTLAGSGTLTWDGKTDTGATASAGVYFIRGETPSGSQSRKVVLLR